MGRSAPPSRLRILEGPGAGDTFPVAGRVRVGRGAGCEVRLSHPSVSREHLVLEPDGDGLRVRDAGSLAGTLLNDKPLDGPAVLAHGDVIEAGVFRLVFEQDRAEPVADPPAETNEIQAAVPVNIPPPPASGGADRTAEVLYRLSGALLTVADPDLMMDRFLAEVLAVLPGDSAALVRADPLSGRLEVRRRAERDPAAADDPPRISRTLLARCIEDRKALLVDNVEGHPALGDQTSVQRHQIRSILCAPLPGRGKDAVPLGAVCLVSRRFNTAFDETALRLLTVTANLAALALSGALDRERLRAENAGLRPGPALQRLLTADPRMKDVLAAVLRVAVLPTTVLVTGETGTGKELIAAALHENSLRCNGPLVKVNCAAISESLLESELFGHEKGAFTDARARRIGKLESAHKGTLFLDEAGEMSPAVQAKLLRALETREFERLGGNDTVKADVRFVAATHRDLAAMVRKGTFREDLFYRLSVVPIRLPALRERPGDIPLLAGHFLREFSAAAGTAPPALTESAAARLREYPWPGNVRELRNVMERLSILQAGRTLTADDVADALGQRVGAVPLGEPPSRDGSGAAIETLAAARARFEAEHIRRALEATRGNITEAARRLGLTREALSRRIHRGDKPADEESRAGPA
jgi:transcriptional regulator with GAF, ATPase, and Fis domain